MTDAPAPGLPRGGGDLRQDRALAARFRLALAGGGAALILAQGAVAASNLGFHVLVSHRLGADSYGVLGALLAVIAAFTVPVGTLQTLLCVCAARHRERNETYDIRRAMHISLLAGVLLAGVLALATPAAMSFFHLRTPWPWLLLAAYAIPDAATVVPWAVLCGERRFATVGATAVLNAAIRIALAAGLLMAGLSLVAALGASVLAEAAQAIVLHNRARAVLRRHRLRTPARLTLDRRRAKNGVVALGGLWVILGLDVLLARHFFPGAAAGRYTAAATGARFSLYFAQAVCILAVPRFAVATHDRARRTLVQVMTVCGAVGLLASATLAVLGPMALPVAFGRQFHADRTLLAILGLSATVLGLLWVVVQYRLARAQPIAARTWATVVLAVIAIAAFHRAPVDLAVDMVAAVLAAGSVWVATTRLGSRRVYRASLTAVAPAVHAASDLDVTVVVPFYNPGTQLRPNVLNLLAALRRCQVSFEVIAVSDGCTDDSAETIADLEGGELRRLALPRNQGKGAALRLGLREGRGRYVGFIDADGDLDPALWEPFMALIHIYRPDIIIGSKVHPLSTVDPDITVARRICSIGYRTLVGLLFPGLPVRDTQVGIKVFRRELLDDVLPRTVERRFIFDLELLVAARRMGYRRIMAAPVDLRAREVSTVNGRAVRRMLVDTLALAWRVYGCRAYEPPPTSDDISTATPDLSRLPDALPARA